ncbi:MAG: 4Fe-4S dicluster domain-containing protein [Gammaproteobacteria bacterium]|nr:4Fe-4S dicluster domain-containing protein [Gammaproteobacteria bacterium]
MPKTKLSQASRELACIRCGYCAEVCPENLLPQQLLSHSKVGDMEAQLQLSLINCTECGDCEQVCPSNIGLVEHFRNSKLVLTNETLVSERSRVWQQQFERFQERRGRQQSAVQVWIPSIKDNTTGLSILGSTPDWSETKSKLVPSNRQKANVMSKSDKVTNDAHAGFSREQAQAEIAAAVARVKQKRD